MLYVLIGIASLGGLLFGYETGVAAGALRSAQAVGAFTPNDQVLLSSGTLFGALIGALSAGRTADLVGRRDVIMATSALFTMGALLSAIAPSSLVLFAGRLVVGMGVGAISVAAPLYIAEISPAARRGRLITVFQLMVTIGILLAYVGNEMFAGQPEGWRLLLAAGAVPGLFLSGLALLLVESPVWLAMKGDQESAMAVLDRLGLAASKPEIEALGPMAREGRSEDLSALFSLAGRAAIFLGVGLFFVQQFVGINVVIYYSASSLGDLSEYLDFGVRDSLGLSVAILNVLATVVAIVLIDRVGRRPLLLASLIGIAAGLITMAVAPGLESDVGGTHILSAAGLYLFIVSFAVGIGPIAWVVAAEIAPVHVRGLAMSIIVASHWLFDSLASPSGLLLSSEAGRALLPLTYATIALAGFALFRKSLPETMGMTLAAIDRHFVDFAASVKDSRFVHYSVTTLATMGEGLIGYNFAILSLTLVLVADEWKLNDFETGALASSLVVGAAAGSFLAGTLADRFGRRYVLMSMAALFVASAFGSALAPSLGWLIAARAAAGVAMGITLPTAGLYVAEVAPSVIRGRLLSFEAVAYATGGLLAYVVGLALESEPNGWRYMFGFIALPSTIYGLGLLPLPESPRWLAAVAQFSAARRSLRRLLGAEADRELARITADQQDPANDHDHRPRGWRGLWAPAYRTPVSVGLMLMFLSVFAGSDMVLFYAPMILRSIGFEDTTTSFAATLGLGTVFLVMTLVSLALIDTVGRRAMVLGGLAVMSSCLLVMTALTLLPAPDSELVRWGQVAALAVFVGAFALTLGHLGDVIISELYPHEISGPATSLTHGMEGVFAIVFSATFPILLSLMGLTATFLSYAVIGALGAIYLWRTLPETKGRTLEEIGDYWHRRAAQRGDAAKASSGWAIPPASDRTQ
jgi:sugar porter (SP) family MFS transporter